MNNFDFETKKFRILLIVICSLFILLIWQAFSYLPQEDENINFQEISQTETSLAKKEVELDNTEELDNNEEAEFLDETIISEDEIDPPPTEIKKIVTQNQFKTLTDSESGKILTLEKKEATDIIDNLIEEANILKKEQKYQEAVKKFEEILTICGDNNNVKSEALEEIAILYAKMKRYGSALSFAQKSYNLAPSIEKEMLIARLYYKVGETDRAQMRINNILKREF